MSITLTPNGGDIAVTDEFFEVVLEVVAVGLHLAGLVVAPGARAFAIDKTQFARQVQRPTNCPDENRRCGRVSIRLVGWRPAWWRNR